MLYVAVKAFIFVLQLGDSTLVASKRGRRDLEVRDDCEGSTHANGRVGCKRRGV